MTQHELLKYTAKKLTELGIDSRAYFDAPFSDQRKMLERAHGKPMEATYPPREFRSHADVELDLDRALGTRKMANAFKKLIARAAKTLGKP